MKMIVEVEIPGVYALTGTSYGPRFESYMVDMHLEKGTWMVDLETETVEAYPRDYKMPTIDPDAEDECPILDYINSTYEDPFDIFNDENHAECTHSWKTYNSLFGTTGDFEYCDHCGVKK